MKMKIGWKIGGIILLVAVIAMGAIGISYSANGNPNSANKSLCTFSWVYSNDAGNSLDPKEPQAAYPGTVGRFANHVGTTTAAINIPPDTITITLENAYPGYYPTVFFGVSNQWTTPGIVKSINIQNPPEFTGNLTGIKVNDIIDVGKEAVGALSIGATGANGQDIPQGQSFSFTVKIVVTQWTGRGTFIITTPSLPAGELGVSYTQTLAATRGNTPYTWSLILGSLPDGLSLSDGGVISGIPTKDGSYDFTVRATDSTGDTATKAFSIKIAPRPVITTLSPLPNGTKNGNYSQNLSATGGTTPYTWSIISGILPNGLSLNSSTGAITGKSTKAGTFTFTIQVRDSLGATGTKSFTITIK